MSAQSFEQALVVELGSIQGLSNKVYPITAIEGLPAPYIAYGSSDGLRDKALGGYLNSKSIDAELNIIASTYADMKRLSTAAVDKIISLESRVIGNGGPYIQELTYTRPVELYENLPKLYRCVIELKICF